MSLNISNTHDVLSKNYRQVSAGMVAEVITQASIAQRCAAGGKIQRQCVIWVHNSKNFVEINFEKQPSFAKLFQDDLDVKRIVSQMAAMVA